MMASTRVFVCLYAVCICSCPEARSTSQFPTDSTQVPSSQEPSVGSSLTTGSSAMTESSGTNGSSVSTGSPVMTESPVTNGSSLMTESPVANGSSLMTESPVGNGSSVMTASPVTNGSSLITESSVANGSSLMTESPVANGSSVMTASPVANDSSVMTESPVANGSSVMTESPVATGSSVTTKSFVTSNDTMSSDHTRSSTMSSDSSSPMSSDRSPQPTSSSPNPTTQAQQTTIATSTTSPMSVPQSNPTTAGVTPGPGDTSYFNIVVSIAIIGGVLAFLTVATICIYVCVLQPRKKQSVSLEESATTKKKKKKKRKKTSLHESDVSELIVAIDKQSKPLEMDRFDNNSSDGDMETVQVHKENTEMQNGVEHRTDPKAGGGTQPSKKIDSNDTNNVRISIHRELLEMTKRRSINQDSGETNRQMSTFGKAGILDRSASTVSSISLKGIAGVGGQGHGLTDNPEDPEDKAGGEQEVDGDNTKKLVRQDAISSDSSVENAVPEPGHSETELEADSQQEGGGTKQLVRQNSFTEDSVSEGGRSESDPKADTQQENGDTNDQKSISSTDDNQPEDGHSESELHSDSQQGEGQTKQLESQTDNDLVPDTEDSVPESDPVMQPDDNEGSEYVPEPENNGSNSHGLGQPKYSEESYSQAYECEAFEDDDLESVDEDRQLADGGMQVDPDDGQAGGHRHMDIDAMVRARVGDGLSNTIMSTRL